MNGFERAARLLMEWDSVAAAGSRPDTSGVRMGGAQKNFTPLERESGWPYTNDLEMSYGVPQGPTGIDRGTQMGTDVSGGPPTPGAYAEPPDADQIDGYYDLDEAMGTPYNFTIGNRAGNMSGGTTPGVQGGWAKAPSRPEDSDDPRKNPMLTYEESVEPIHTDLKDFFNADVPPTERLTNLDPSRALDQTDEDLEARLDDFDPHIGDDGDPQRFTGRMNPQNIFIVATRSGNGEYIASPDQHGSARGTYGMHSDVKKPEDVFPSRSNWELLMQGLEFPTTD